METKKKFARVFSSKAPEQKASPVAVQHGPAPHVDWVAVIDSHLWKYGNEPERKAHRKQGVFHPSSGLHPDSGLCVRSVMFDLIYAERSRTAVPQNILKAMDNGTGRHLSIGKYFRQMAEVQHFGIVHVEEELEITHPRLPIYGHADLRVTFASGYRHMLDIKTCSPKQAEKTFAPSPEYKLQLNTYMGCTGDTTGYVLYENRANQQWLGPMSNFRVDFNPDMFAETEQYCIDILRSLSVGDMPEYDEGICKANLMFCSYTGVCEQQRSYTDLANYDRRPDDVRKMHLKVIQ